jgi:hypothetical protein
MKLPVKRVGKAAGSAIGFKLCGAPCAAVGARIGKAIAGGGEKFIKGLLKRKLEKHGITKKKRKNRVRKKRRSRKRY